MKPFDWICWMGLLVGLIIVNVSSHMWSHDERHAAARPHKECRPYGGPSVPSGKIPCYPPIHNEPPQGEKEKSK